MCFYRGCQVESVNHPTACYHVNTGNRFGGDPAVGAWVTYGLGTLNDNLPALWFFHGRVIRRVVPVTGRMVFFPQITRVHPLDLRKSHT